MQDGQHYVSSRFTSRCLDHNKSLSVLIVVLYDGHSIICYNNNKMDRYLLPEPLPATGNPPEQWAGFKNNLNSFLTSVRNLAK